MSEDLLQTHYLLQIIDQISANVFWKDDQLRYAYCNDSMAAILKLTDKQAITGKTDQDLLPHKIANQIRGNDQHILETGNTLCLTEEGFDEKGERAVYLSKKSPLYSPSGKMVGIAGISTDITAAITSDQTKVAFVANITHDVKTPLGGLLSFAENEARQLPDGHPMRASFEIVHASARQFQTMMESIVETVKLDHRRNTGTPEPFCVATLVQGIVEIFRPSLIDKGLACHVNPIDPAAPTVVIGLPKIIKKALISLVSNAVKFTDAGYITIEYVISQTPEGDPNARQLRFSVKDTGCGIPLKSQPQIFDLFYRGSFNHESNQSGIGLGLYLAKKCMQQLGGQITFTSAAPGGGSTFTCFIPVQMAQHPLTEHAAS